MSVRVTRRGTWPRNQHRVDDVHHAVAGIVVSGSDLGHMVDVHVTVADVHVYVSALKSLERVHGLEVLAVHSSSRNHVVLENGVQLFDVLGFK